MQKTALILGAHGRFGHNAANAFRNAGWQVETFDRARDDLPTKMARASITVMGWNPPYHQWASQTLPLHRKVARTAAETGSTVIIPGNVYVFGPDAPRPWGPDTPQLADNPLGLLRREAEAAYREAGARAILLRCGDFIDTQPSENWFEAYLAKTARKGRMSYPGNPDAAH
ncbi:MAG TPA: epimerase, partial [Aliiroseovarius sp.]|nr:epimerase [Aliiroseovarius sp.]